MPQPPDNDTGLASVVKRILGLDDVQKLLVPHAGLSVQSQGDLWHRAQTVFAAPLLGLILRVVPGWRPQCKTGIAMLQENPTKPYYTKLGKGASHETLLYKT